MRIAMIVLICVASGCATKNSMESPRLYLGGAASAEQVDKSKAIEQALTDKDLAMMLDARVTAKLPTNLAVARVCASGPSLYLQGVDASEAKGWESTVAGIEGIRSVRVVSHLSEPKAIESMRGLRAAAARMNCELLLVYATSESAVDNMTDAAALYWTVVGLWLVPGNVHERKTVAQAVLIDCRTGMILGTASGEHHARTSYAAAYREIAHDKLQTVTTPKALESLRANAGKMMRQVLAEADSTRVAGG
jgi:hypothetical protein